LKKIRTQKKKILLNGFLRTDVHRKIVLFVYLILWFGKPTEDTGESKYCLQTYPHVRSTVFQYLEVKEKRSKEKRTRREEWGGIREEREEGGGRVGREERREGGED
jgi:hypothetical protein